MESNREKKNMYKTDTKNEAKRSRATTFSITKWEAREEIQIVSKIISHFWGTNNIFVACTLFFSLKNYLS